MDTVEPTRWYVLRALYGKGADVYEDLKKLSLDAFFPTHRVVQRKNSVMVMNIEPYIPSLVFVRSQKSRLEEYMLSGHGPSRYVHFYRDRTKGKTDNFKNPPLVISDRDMDSFQIICGAPKDDIRIADSSQVNFKTGQWVRVTDGEFKGVIGRIAIWKNQTRIGVDIEGLFTVFTTYVPKAFIEPIPDYME